MKIFLLLLCSLALAFGKPFVPLTESEENDLRHVLEVIKAASVEQAAKLESAEAKASDAVAQLNATHGELAKAQDEVVALQIVIGTYVTQRDKALAEVVIQRRWKWRWFWVATGEGLILVALVYLKLKP